MQQHHDPFTPSPHSLAFRANLAKLISPLKRVRPSVPFWKLGAHRVPTLWGLYRGLLRNAPSDNIRYRVEMMFRKNRYMTGPRQTKRELLKGYKWLNFFQAAQSGDSRKQAVLSRYDQFISMKIEKEHWKRLVRNEIEWQNRLRNRPILTGGFLQPTAHHPPLPRLKPQPKAISGMIIKRMRARERQFMRSEALGEMKDLIKEERFFEQMAPSSQRSQVYGGSAYYEWSQSAPLSQARQQIFETSNGVLTRMMRPFPPDLIDQVREARKNKIANRTKELKRERRGEVTARTLKRRRKGLPAHVWTKLSEKDRKEELIVQRSVSEVGYVGMLKKERGWKLSEPKEKVEGKVWSIEEGRWIGEEDDRALDKALGRIRRENERRRAMRDRTLGPVDDVEGCM
ncbi:hypothetical protein K435DRAFT_647156 [Dendrothele bispora CBS 962.96]|uniref:Uncharacterized protein n=1 Tax=Dendrothele bispora (strain CBS 962.96) TaxID=1314807 RepID=A0A4V4HI64_DENBC|nr:hypothetical protein K435DRAFT_647156 [Dendrothele bispora CBS 962.96]